MGSNADRLHGPPPEDPAARRSVRGGSARSTVTIRAGTTTDAAAAAELHAGAITEGFLSLLGPAFLRRLYRRICLHPSAFLSVAEAEERVVGFIAGATDVPGLYRSFIGRDGPAAALSALGPLARGWRRVYETLRHGMPDGRGTGGAELLSVAVAGPWRGQGTAQRLVASFLDEVTARGCSGAHVVVGADNRQAVALYRRSGFVVAERFELHPGTESLLMRWEVPGPPVATRTGPG